MARPIAAMPSLLDLAPGQRTGMVLALANLLGIWAAFCDQNHDRCGWPRAP